MLSDEQVGTQPQCPECYENIQGDENICPHCHADLRETVEVDNPDDNQ